MNRFTVIFLSTFAFFISYVGIWYLLQWLFPSFDGAVKAATCAVVTVILTPRIQKIDSQLGKKQTLISWMLVGKSWVV
ncbi:MULTISPECIES: hypothetical protein [Leeuwenhoekiella]|jgi:hypothetical protein|uniref:Uncharacterized protein n=1 Tax=Leeuwenhoekiella blandensis (strain CECT 7118 / CCUG 51940 / KCTC 22103 / MED217) TaxID=398720 RepID=A3XQ31_LEEBM|nr:MULTISPECIES: hypothetical protein [Leeuwenhoekiella]EAQ48347.1 hypothetical protein MED217_12609 [Leeuwenhoekiella blandensis MED217]MAO42282.1 hypothetical protein [Leeuwenhoekiella sp.]MBQ51317.1 hypothetical protein [Leeuwenhoekiella sp.]HBT10059.1 hypothetical protein [Leeuwenhoekiella sp.]|tara:strand:+ start:4919 stop:5152 length:234 start_codon:yes stop_codon:yes gene_type:complete